MLKEKIVGLRLSIVGDDSVEDLCFTEKFVTATQGSKSGPLCAPLLNYKITGADSLVIEGGGFDIRWTQIEFVGETLEVVRNSNPVVYRIVSRS